MCTITILCAQESQERGHLADVLAKRAIADEAAPAAALPEDNTRTVTDCTPGSPAVLCDAPVDDAAEAAQGTLVQPEAATTPPASPADAPAAPAAAPAPAAPAAAGVPAMTTTKKPAALPKPKPAAAAPKAAATTAAPASGGSGSAAPAAPKAANAPQLGAKRRGMLPVPKAAPKPAASATASASTAQGSKGSTEVSWVLQIFAGHALH